MLLQLYLCFSQRVATHRDSRNADAAQSLAGVQRCTEESKDTEVRLRVRWCEVVTLQGETSSLCVCPCVCMRACLGIILIGI